MPVLSDYSWSQGDDGTLVISMVPPTTVGGWSAQFNFQNRFGGISGWGFKYVASGYGGGQSGITVTDSGQGRFQVRIDAVDTSGLAFGAYAFSFKRTGSGVQTALTEGYELLGP